MKINEKTLKKIARLARLHIDEDKLLETERSLSQIVTWMEQLDKVSTDHVVPLLGVTLDHMPRQEDLVEEGGIAEKIVKNAAETQLNMFVVPKVVE